MGSRRLGRRRLKSLDDRILDANDAWGVIRPLGIALPGLQRGIKSVQLHPGNNTEVGELGAEDANTSIWLADVDGGDATVALKGDHADFTDGAIVCTSHSDNNDTAGITMPNFPFDCRSGKKWWVETAFSVEDLTACEVFFGLHEAQYASKTNLAVAAAGDGSDTVAFAKATVGTGAITVKQSVGDTAAATALDSALTIANNSDVVRLGIHWNGTVVEYYGAITTTATGYQSEAMPKVATRVGSHPEEGVKLALSLQIASNGATEALSINYIRGAWEI